MSRFLGQDPDDVDTGMGTATCPAIIFVVLTLYTPS